MKVLSICIQTQHSPLAQVKAFGGSRSKIAKTDLINAELIARPMVFRPDAGRRLPRGKLRDIWTLTTVVHTADTKPVARNIYGNSRWLYGGSCTFPSDQRLWSVEIA